MSSFPQAADPSALISAFQSRSAKIGIVGLGYVGLPLALTAIGQGFAVLGFDVNKTWLDRINRGEPVIKHVALEIKQAVASDRLETTSDLSRLNEPDVILICVPTPLTRHREPDMSFIEGSARAIAACLRKGQLIVLESTTYPGTTEEFLRPILETSGLKSERDFFLAFSPEREDPGNIDYRTSAIPKVIGADGPHALAVTEELYKKLVVRTVPVSSSRAAEAVKLTENIFRAVNIALMNELKIVYDAMGIDIWEVIEAAKTKPFGFMPFYPGPGLGGHCIPIDPFYLTWKAREYDIATRFIELAGEINTRMPYHVVDRVAEAIDRLGGRSVTGARVLVVGVSYKRNVDDLRESPALKIIELLEDRGALVNFHDPFFPVLPQTRQYARFAGRRSVQLTASTIAAHDAALITTDHDDIDFPFLVEKARIVIDTRNACARAGAMGDNVVKA